ncbi:MAG: hypothetical protein JNN18_09505 [Rubrivivax sp.]|jgi:hypothetical protein|nr:hypothetical protein [Rubrivivax sp.]HRG71350.1 DUF6148 family protein [Thauera aminoaromatica]
MAGITLAQAEAKLALYLEAETAVLAKQSYTIAGRSLTYADLGEIRAGIQAWDARCKQLEVEATTGGSRLRTIVAR